MSLGANHLPGNEFNCLVREVQQILDLVLLVMKIFSYTPRRMVFRLIFRRIFYLIFTGLIIYRWFSACIIRLGFLEFKIWYSGRRPVKHCSEEFSTVMVIENRLSDNRLSEYIPGMVCFEDFSKKYLSWSFVDIPFDFYTDLVLKIAIELWNPESIKC